MFCPNCNSNDIIPERSSGYDGYRCNKCGEWNYSTHIRQGPEDRFNAEQPTEVYILASTINVTHGHGDFGKEVALSTKSTYGSDLCPFFTSPEEAQLYKDKYNIYGNIVLLKSN